MANGNILVRLTLEERAAIERARGDVSVGLWAKRRLMEAATGSRPAPAAPSPAPVRQVSAARVTAPASAPPDDRRAAARAALATVPRRMVPSQRAAEPGDTVLDYDDAQA